MIKINIFQGKVHLHYRKGVVAGCDGTLINGEPER